MNYPEYNLVTNTDATVFEFVSEGIKGKIVKAIVYSPTGNEMIYNLGFGDKIILDEQTGEIDVDDSTVSIFGAILQADEKIIDVPFDSKIDFYGFLIKRK